MATNTLLTIKRLIGSLPAKDIPFAEKFIAKRDFESLKELVESAMFKIRKSLASEKPKEEYLTINMDLLESLLTEVMLYLSYLDISEFDNDEDTQFYEAMCEQDYEEW